jgi:hypothetical protein
MAAIDHAAARRQAAVLHAVATGEVQASDPSSDLYAWRGPRFEFEVVALSE